ncbi:MAG: HEAT repeat domain-containing protein [Ardenticatenaceae bacterium]|nr:HEAT repeat domain-containing protein [Ardenticatenaceae bacterium]
MFDWLRKIWDSKHQKTQKRNATQNTHKRNNKSSTPKTTTRSDNQNPILVRGRLWKNTAETQWELPSEPETFNDLSIEVLIKQLARIDRTELRLAAAKRLGQLGSSAKSAIPALVNTTVDIDSEVRNSALNALYAIDPDWTKNPKAHRSFPTLVTALKSQHSEVKNSAFSLLQMIGSPAVPTLVYSLSNKDDAVEKVYVIQILANIGPRAENAIPELVQSLGSRFLQTRIAAAEALANIGPTAVESAIPALIAGLNDPFAGGREAMATCLSHAGPAAELGIPALLPLLSDREAKVRKAAANALKQIGPKTISPLLKILQTRDIIQLKTWNQIMLEEWLRTKPIHIAVTPDYLNVLRNLSWAAYHIMEEQESLEAAHESALDILAEFGAEAETAVTTVTNILADPNPKIQIAAIKTLGQIGSAASTSTLKIVYSLTNPNLNIRLAAVKTLGQIGKQAESAIPKLVPLLVDNNEVVRQETAKSLKSINDNWSLNPAASRAIADLTGQLKSTGKPGEIASQVLTMIGAAAVPALINTLEFGTRVAQENAATILGNIGKEAKPAIPALNKAIQESHPWVQDKATKALVNIAKDYVTKG